MSEPVLRVESLTKRFGGITAVDALSFDLAGGRLLAIIGPNGAGKTTFFNLVSSLLPCDGGRVLFHGRDITRLRPHLVSRLGIKRTLQIKSVFPQLTVAENLWITSAAGRGFLHPFRAAASDRAARERVDDTLAELDLAPLADRLAGTLSYGDVALLEIGMALISQPRLLLLDEPTCGMSPAETTRAVAKIRELARRIDIIIIEHDMEVVFEIADDIIVMAQGAILARGGPREIAADARVREAYLGAPEDDLTVEDAAHA
ncbi:MAG: ABC transporter ATP-binding protein [Proteobacteria bacterium]|nr:ABC transporter ATP-binding protein [Pseudomonadota bacterium]